MSTQKNFLFGSPWSEKQKSCQIFPEPVPKSLQISSSIDPYSYSNNAQYLTDRLTPKKINDTHYKLLISEEMGNSNSSRKSSVRRKIDFTNMSQTTQFTTGLDDNNNNESQTDKNINDSLVSESTSNKYTKMLKMNILSTVNDYNNCNMNNIQKDPILKGQPEKILKYKKPERRRNSEMILNYSHNPLQLQQQIVVPENQNQVRKISKRPYKVLDAPGLQDDFYCNLLDWSSRNMIGISLDNAIYTWSVKTAQAQKLAEFSESNVTSLSWHPQGVLMGCGDHRGELKIFDTEKHKIVKKYKNHENRIGALSWNNNLITTGGKDSKIYVADIRTNDKYAIKFQGHKQEVCGAKWSCDGQTLASGGNDNKVMLWSPKMGRAIGQFTEHIAAVKALTWSPHNKNLLVTGGGTQDKTLKFWNTGTKKLIQSIDTGSQICNMTFSRNANELVTTHGFSMNQLAVWKINENSSSFKEQENISHGFVPNRDISKTQEISRIATLYGHTYRVLYLAISPDGENIVTGSGDETLRFWKIFPSNRMSLNNNKSCLDSFRMEIR